jgi:hypothetical protein
MADNRCVICNHFRPWKMLRLTKFVPDSPFGREIHEFTCLDCKPELEELYRKLWQLT